MTGQPAFLFAHGWSLDASLWDGIRAAMPAATTETTERGQLGATPRWPAMPPGYVAVGHSAGLLDLLADLPPGCAGLVSINGFTRFAAAADFPHGVPARVLTRMLNRLSVDPAGTVDDFRLRCGDRTGLSGTLRPDLLRDGLLSLCRRDMRALMPIDGVPMLALASGADAIVSRAMTTACFSARVTRWRMDAGHLLPLTHASWCAEQLGGFARDGLRPCPPKTTP